MPGRPGVVPPRWSDTPMILWRCATPRSRQSRSRRGLPGGWRREGWPSTRTRPAWSTSVRVLTSSGFTVRRFPSRRGGKLIIKPSAAAVRRFKRRLATEFRSLRGANAAAVLARIAPVTRGWGAFYRTVVSSRVFSGLDDYLWKLCYKWATWSHRKKPKPWIAGRYFGRFHPGRADRWVFGDRASGAYLPRLAWMKIERHQMVAGTASPDDPSLAAHGLTGAAGPGPRSATARCGCCASSAGAARYAGTISCTPTTSPAIPENGSAGSPPPARRSRAKPWPPPGAGARRTISAAWIHAYCWRRATGARTATELLHL